MIGKQSLTHRETLDPLPTPEKVLIESIREHLIWTSGWSPGIPTESLPTDEMWGRKFREAMRHLDALAALVNLAPMDRA